MSTSTVPQPAAYTPANPMVTAYNLDLGEVEHMRKLTFQEHFESFGWRTIEPRRCATCQRPLPVLCGGPTLGQPWRLDNFPRCSTHAF